MASTPTCQCCCDAKEQSYNYIVMPSPAHHTEFLEYHTKMIKQWHRLAKNAPAFENIFKICSIRSSKSGALLITISNPF